MNNRGDDPGEARKMLRGDRHPRGAQGPGQEARRASVALTGTQRGPESSKGIVASTTPALKGERADRPHGD